MVLLSLLQHTGAECLDPFQPHPGERVQPPGGMAGALVNDDPGPVVYGDGFYALDTEDGSIAWSYKPRSRFKGIPPH